MDLPLARRRHRPMGDDVGDYRRSEDYRRRAGGGKQEPFAMAPGEHAQPGKANKPPGLDAVLGLLSVPVVCFAIHRFGRVRWDAVRFLASALCVGQALCHPYAWDSWFKTRRPDRPNGTAENAILSAFVGYLVRAARARLHRRRRQPCHAAPRSHRPSSSPRRPAAPGRYSQVALTLPTLALAATDRDRGPLAALRRVHAGHQKPLHDRAPRLHRGRMQAHKPPPTTSPLPQRDL